MSVAWGSPQVGVEPTTQQTAWSWNQRIAVTPMGNFNCCVARMMMLFKAALLLSNVSEYFAQIGEPRWSFGCGAIYSQLVEVLFVVVNKTSVDG